ncbi:hypothetical protein B0T17DRAFT_501365 [Bombardia bombarda]|uniref:Uncharacterized protein n=1 Tax=Bombardia bombarda TaxID=252184 RepID=A0AA39W3U2_9PEZI|nr:hypothetical protein B0T17DRAFT_501365 [Bombardia bombarda]
MTYNSNPTIPIIIARNPPSAVTYDLSIPHRVTITLPLGSTWTSGLHFHQTHDEYLCLLKGTVRVRLGDEIHILTASNHSPLTPLEIKVPKGVWHEWSRADGDVGKDEEVIVVERTDPTDGDKAIFFWNLNGVILKAQRTTKPALAPAWAFGLALDIWITLNLFAIFHMLDNIPVLLGARELFIQWGLVSRGSWAEALLSELETAWAVVVLWAAEKVIRVLGEGAVRREFTPEKEYKEWMNRRREKGGVGL